MKDKVNYLLITFISFITGSLVMYYFCHNNLAASMNDSSKGEITCKACNDTVIVENGSLSAAIEKVYDATVMIKTIKNNELISTGSGFVYKTDNKYGYVMTNHHVIEKGNTYKLILSNDKEISAELLSSDEYLDLAVLRIAKDDVLMVASIGKNSECSLGDNVFTVGSPVGYEYRGTVTNGIISGLNRLVEVSTSGSNGDFVMEVIQTNAAVNPGNSGGPMVNAKGEVIGVVSLKLVKDSVEGMGFAIPIEYAMSHVDVLENGKKIERPFLGISMMDVSQRTTIKTRYNISIPSTITEGVVVIDITNGSSASKSDLAKGDVLTKIDGKDIKSPAHLKYLLYKYNIGDTITITYLRNGKYSDTKIKLQTK